MTPPPSPSSCPARWRPPSRPRPAAWRATPSGYGRRRAGRPHHPRRASASCRSSSPPATSLVVNVSETLPAAVAATRGRRHAPSASISPPGRPSSTTAGGWWSCAPPTAPARRAGTPGETITLPGPDAAHPGLALVAPYASGSRLLLARLDGRGASASRASCADHGEPIRYGYVRHAWPLEAYQNVYARDPRQRRDAQCRASGHAPRSSPSSSRAGSRWRRSPCTAGVSSPERHEPPFPEEYEVPECNRPPGQRRRAPAVVA